MPAGEFLHPIPLAAVLLLIANDWWLKPGSWAPRVVTGKLSDFAGLLFFPLLVTALIDCVLLGAARLGIPVDFTLRRKKLVLSITATAICFCALKLSPIANQWALDFARNIGLAAHIVLDPWDLLALPMLWISWKIGLSEIARVPLGRIELLLMRHRSSNVAAGGELHDIVAAGGAPHYTRDLIEALDCYLASPAPETARRVSDSLAQLRDLSPKPR